ncbi:MAG TPA: STAS/SEC14 domain-containing protein [Agriterribacter sp.]|nr:STAS/SEC14 domain-containing protein [Agriterribacter sp.]
MIEQIKTFNNNILAFEVIGGFTETDEKIAQKFFNEKLAQGFDKVNILVKIDEFKIAATEAKAFFQDIIFVLRQYKHLGHLAVVAHSKIMKALVPIDNLFFERASKGRAERYFDISRMDEAWAFVGAE